MQGLSRELPSNPAAAYTGPIISLTVRLPRAYHLKLKQAAKARGARTSDYYLTVLDEFIRNDLAGCPQLFAVTDDAVPVSISAPSDLVELVRDTALSRRVGANVLIYTAIAHHLGHLAAS